MQCYGKIQNWGNSAAICFPTDLMAAAGLVEGDEVVICAESGRLFIHLSDQTMEQRLDEWFAQESGAAELLEILKTELEETILMTRKTIQSNEALIKTL